MAGKHVSLFESSLQKTNLWLKDLEEELHLKDRAKSYAALRATLHVLRDCLRAEDAAKLSAQMPMIVTGVFYEGWKPRAKPERPTRAELYDKVRGILRNQPGLDPALTVCAVVRVLDRHLSAGGGGIRFILPRHVRALWEEALEEEAGPRRPFAGPPPAAYRGRRTGRRPGARTGPIRSERAEAL